MSQKAAPGKKPIQVSVAAPAPVQTAAKPDFKWIKVDLIRADPSLQIRETTSQEKIQEYAELMKDPNGPTFPPVRAFRDEANIYWLADGFHRLEATKRAGIVDIAVEYSPGSQRDAFLYALSANTQHGLPRSNRDKHRAVDLALADPELAKLSNREIAKICAVSHVFVMEKKAGKKPEAPEVAGFKSTLVEDRMKEVRALNTALSCSMLLATKPGGRVQMELLAQRRHLEDIEGQDDLQRLVDDFGQLAECNEGTRSALFRRVEELATKPLGSAQELGLHPLTPEIIRDKLTDPKTAYMIATARDVAPDVRLEAMRIYRVGAVWLLNQYNAEAVLRNPSLGRAMKQAAQARLERIAAQEAEKKPKEVDVWRRQEDLIKAGDQAVMNSSDTDALVSVYKALQRKQEGGPETVTMRLARLRLDELGIKARECPDPRCVGYLSFEERCSKCYRTPKEAVDQWNSEVKAAIRILKLGGFTYDWGTVDLDQYPQEERVVLVSVTAGPEEIEVSARSALQQVKQERIERAYLQQRQPPAEFPVEPEEEEEEQPELSEAVLAYQAHRRTLDHGEQKGLFP